MDFPIKLRNTFVVGMEEFRQVLTLILKESVGSFLQNPTLGATFSIHTDDTTGLQLAVQHTLEQVPNTTLEYINVYKDAVDIAVRYNDHIENFIFEVATNEN